MLMNRQKGQQGCRIRSAEIPESVGETKSTRCCCMRSTTRKKTTSIGKNTSPATLITDAGLSSPEEREKSFATAKQALESSFQRGKRNGFSDRKPPPTKPWRASSLPMSRPTLLFKQLILFVHGRACKNWRLVSTIISGVFLSRSWLLASKLRARRWKLGFRFGHLSRHRRQRRSDTAGCVMGCLAAGIVANANTLK